MDTQETAGKLGNVMKGADLTKYVKGAAKTVNGNKTHDTGDRTAERLRGMPIDAVYIEAAQVTGTPEGELRARYQSLNLGMQRMNLGNRIRAALRAKDAPPKPPKAEKAPKPAKVVAGVPKAAKADTKKAEKPLKTAAPKAPTKPGKK